MEKIVLAGGCFWCIEASFNLINGVVSAVSGYSGGSEKDAEYYAVASGSTEHAESVEVTYDPNIISLNDILDIFWAIHDPTTLNRQGNDVGPQYRSAIFYADETQRLAAEASKLKVQELWPNPVVTEIVPLEHFYRAEEYHQNYFANNPEQAYCQIVINPKLIKLKEKFAARIKA